MNMQQHRQHIMMIKPNTIYNRIFNNGSSPNGAMTAVDELLFALAPEPEPLSVSVSVSPLSVVSSLPFGSDSPVMGEAEGGAVGSPTITI